MDIKFVYVYPIRGLRIYANIRVLDHTTTVYNSGWNFWCYNV